MTFGMVPRVVLWPAYRNVWGLDGRTRFGPRGKEQRKTKLTKEHCGHPTCVIARHSSRRRPSQQLTGRIIAVCGATRGHTCDGYGWIGHGAETLGTAVDRLYVGRDVKFCPRHQLTDLMGRAVEFPSSVDRLDVSRYCMVFPPIL